MRPSLIILAIILSFQLFAQQNCVYQLSWVEKDDHSGAPDWKRLSGFHLSLVDKKQEKLIEDTTSKILSFDLLVYNEQNQIIDSFHVNNLEFEKSYKSVKDRLRSGTVLEIRNLFCYIPRSIPAKFYLTPDQNLVFRILIL